MADQNSLEYARAYVTKPADKLNPSELNGRKRILKGTITLGAEIGINDSIFMAKIPANAVIVGAALSNVSVSAEDAVLAFPATSVTCDVTRFAPDASSPVGIVKST